MKYVAGHNNQLDSQVANYFNSNPDAMIVTVLRWNEKSYIQWLGDRQDSEALRNEYEEIQIKFHRAIKHFDKVKKKCEICGKEFEASKTAKFCSNACRQKNKYSKLKS